MLSIGSAHFRESLLGFTNANIVAVALDLIEASLLSVVLFVVGPISFLRNLSLGKAYHFALILLPQGILSTFMRALIDLRLGQGDRAVAAIESTIGTLEESGADTEKFSPVLNAVLTRIYALLTNTHLSYGHIDDAALTVIRAGRSLNVDKINGVQDFDVKIAQIVRAGIAAGKLLEQGGLTTFMLQQPIVKKGKIGSEKTAAEGDKAGVDQVVPNPGAKVIPFPRPFLH